MSRRSTFSVAVGVALVVLASSVMARAQTAPTNLDVIVQDRGPELPPVTDAERATAFPDVGGHAAHDNDVHYRVLLDRLEWHSAEGGRAANWDSTSWVGRDTSRLWIRSEGQTRNSSVHDADVHALYGRAFARWWDVVAGIRQDFAPGVGQTWAAVGVQGLAPLWFEVAATAYVGPSGRTAARLEAEYELRLTNRLIVQPRLEVNLSGKTDVTRGVSAGLSRAEPGFRMRYEFRREFAPYLGLEWDRAFGATAQASVNGEDAGGVRAVAGLRFWF